MQKNVIPKIEKRGQDLLVDGKLYAQKVVLQRQEGFFSFVPWKRPHPFSELKLWTDEIESSSSLYASGDYSHSTIGGTAHLQGGHLAILGNDSHRTTKIKFSLHTGPWNSWPEWSGSVSTNDYGWYFNAFIPKSIFEDLMKAYRSDGLAYLSFEVASDLWQPKERDVSYQRAWHTSFLERKIKATRQTVFEVGDRSYKRALRDTRVFVFGIRRADVALR